MKRKGIVNYLFGNSMHPVLFAFVSLPVFIIGVFLGVDGLQLIGNLLLMVSMLWLILSIFVLLFRRQWRAFFYTFLFLATFVMILGLMAS